MQIIKNATACPKPFPQDVRHNLWESFLKHAQKKPHSCSFETRMWLVFYISVTNKFISI